MTQILADVAVVVCFLHAAMLPFGIVWKVLSEVYCNALLLADILDDCICLYTYFDSLIQRCFPACCARRNTR